MKWKTFVKKFKPVKNQVLDHEGPLDGYMFETFGPEREKIHSLAEATMVDGKNGYHIWTLVDSAGNNKLFLLNGWHIVNRLGYVYTEKPWKEGEEIEVEV